MEVSAYAGNLAQPLHFETVIIGTGFSGLLAAIRLQKKHCSDFVLLERSAELGGTWQANSYPGAEVDIPTSLYCISFIPYPFRKTFSPQSELLAYTNHVIDRFGLRKHARTNQTVTRLAFDEREFLWRVETASGERYTARFVIDTSGVLANPRIPAIDGAETFKGAKFHSGHWDHSVAYEGKRVGVIGSGCSAAQIVPAIAGKVSRLTLFMGKAQWILPRSDRQYGAAERFVRTLPGMRHLIRLLVFAFYDTCPHHEMGYLKHPVHRLPPLSRDLGNQPDHEGPLPEKAAKAPRQVHQGRQAAPAHDARLRAGRPAGDTYEYLSSRAVPQ